MVGVKGKSGNPDVYKYGFGSRPIEVDEEYRSRQKGVPHKRKWTREICIQQLEELMDILQKKIKNDNFKELTAIIDKMMDIIKYMYPPVQKSLNVNIDNTESSKMQEIWTICQQEENERIKQQSNKGESDKGEEC